MADKKKPDLTIANMRGKDTIVEVPSMPENFPLPKIVQEALDVALTPAMQDLLQQVNTGTRGQVFQLRRLIRYRIFRIRDGGKIAEQHDHGLKAFLERQFTPEMNWGNFTFLWDVAPNNPLEIIQSSITNNEWRERGGSFDGADRRYPPAFTQQK